MRCGLLIALVRTTASRPYLVDEQLLDGVGGGLRGGERRRQVPPDRGPRQGNGGTAQHRSRRGHAGDHRGGLGGEDEHFDGQDRLDSTPPPPPTVQLLLPAVTTNGGRTEDRTCAGCRTTGGRTGRSAAGISCLHHHQLLLLQILYPLTEKNLTIYSESQPH